MNSKIYNDGVWKLLDIFGDWIILTKCWQIHSIKFNMGQYITSHQIDLHNKHKESKPQKQFIITFNIIKILTISSPLKLTVYPASSEDKISLFSIC